MVEADRVHNPKAVGSNPTPATKTRLRGAANVVLEFLRPLPVSFAAESGES